MKMDGMVFKVKPSDTLYTVTKDKDGGYTVHWCSSVKYSEEQIEEGIKSGFWEIL